tara:strand:- start:236 stop:721 length:486 start_codon:yes stop_codon:yes gene_type:complete
MSQPVTIPGHDGRYEIHPDGRVWSHYGNGRFLKTCTIDGYAVVGLCKDKVTQLARVHRLLAKAYIPNLDNVAFVDHIDRDRKNNALDNLRWVTAQENTQNRTANTGSKTGVLGVYFREARRKQWVAGISVDGKLKTKHFATKEEAVACRKAMELEYYIQPP